jgi:hypothetical protein
MKRADAIALIRLAGYHQDSCTALRIYIENRINFATYKQAWREGNAARESGVKCSCYKCNSAA